MLQSNVGLLSETGLWDNNCARKFLKIPEDQLEIIDKIPGWSKTEVSEKTAAENSPNIEKHLTEKACTSSKNILAANIFAKDSNNIKNQNYNSDLLLKDKTVAPINIPLSSLKKKDTSACSLQRSNSFPDLQQQLQFAQALPHSKSEDILKKQVSHTEKGLSHSEPYMFKENVSIKTCPFPSDDSTNHDKILMISSGKSFSCPLELPNQLSKQRNFKKLDDNILNHKYLKDVNSTSSVKLNVLPSFSNETTRSAEKLEISPLEKKLLLLEKRFSPCKEILSSSRSENLEYLNNKKNENLSLNPAPIDEVLVSRVKRDLIENLPEKTKDSLIPKSNESVELLADSQSTNEKNKIPKSASEAAKSCTIDSISKTDSNFEVSFVSQPVPCGQPLPTEVSSLSQLNSLQKSANLNLPTKSQNTELPVKIIAPENPSSTFNVFANSNEKVSDVASGKELSNKRKRRIRSEKSSKKSDAKKVKRIDVHFSPAQIRNMLEILKILHTDV